MRTFVVDSNFFIQAHRVYYPMDVIPSFWEKVKELAEKGNIVSIDKVKNEIYQNEDELKDWCGNNLPEDFFKNSQLVITAYKKVIDWAVSKNDHYLQRAIDEFLEADEADAWLVAYCLENELAIVTYEVSQPTRKNKIKIPDVCIQFGIPYMNTIELFRELGEKI